MWLVLGCAPDPLAVRRAPPGEDGASTTPIAVDSGATSGTTPVDTGTPARCPFGTADLGVVCVDRWEDHLLGWSPYDVPSGGVAVTEAGAVPQGYISGDVAALACDAAGKRLCTLDEWLLACSGDQGGGGGRAYPYGDVYVPGACNEGRATNPVLDVFGAGADWSSTEMNDPRLNQLPDSLAPAGAFGQCVTPDEVYDLHGNLHEWIDDPSGTFKGGFYVDATINGSGCSYTTTAHTTDYHDYSTGFRCCADPG